MKKTTLNVLALLLTCSIYSQITHNDIADFTFTPDTGATIDIDFNNDGTPEFTLDEQGGGTVGTFFDPNLVNFFGTGTFADGHGWDIIKSLNNGDLIDTSGVFDAMGDAYINAFWANANEMFPEGDSYIGVRFKLGANTHYGWMHVNSTASVITLLDYAYNDTPYAAINAGATLGIQNYANNMKVSYHPNPTRNFISIKSDQIIEEAYLIGILGKTTVLNIINNRVNISAVPNGVYFLHVKSDENTAIKKIIKI